MLRLLKWAYNVVGLVSFFAMVTYVLYIAPLGIIYWSNPL